MGGISRSLGETLFPSLNTTFLLLHNIDRSLTAFRFHIPSPIPVPSWDPAVPWVSLWWRILLDLMPSTVDSPVWTHEQMLVDSLPQHILGLWVSPGIPTSCSSPISSWPALLCLLHQSEGVGSQVSVSPNCKGLHIPNSPGHPGENPQTMLKVGADTLHPLCKTLSLTGHIPSLFNVGEGLNNCATGFLNLCSNLSVEV